MAGSQIPALRQHFRSLQGASDALTIFALPCLRLTAKALLGMGRCYERLGPAEARKAYGRLLREFADQADLVAEARARLAALDKGHSPEPAFGIRARQIWTGPEVDVEGDVSPDGRFITFTDWSTGDLAVRDLIAGTNRRLTNKGTWEQSDEFAEGSRFSRDGKQIAYNYWSPDGKFIAVGYFKRDFAPNIMLVSAAGGPARRVVVPLPVSLVGSPGRVSFSPDGRDLVYDAAPGSGATQRDDITCVACRVSPAP